ncbi:helix-turn-helix domain-containing protein [Deinococcus radiophilus]|uniref:AlbA family DNA-binding domain-containing protein n=1 Tax=Deinococcus radiophilus TaxID=32062 RepID=UPI00360B0486
MTDPATLPAAVSPLGVVSPPGPECIHLSAAVLPDELARYAIGLANARGGTILVGADESAEVEVKDLHPLMLTHAIFELSGGRLSVNVQSHRQPGGHEVLSVFVPRAPYVLSDPAGAVLAWDGHHLVPVSQTEAEPVADADYTAIIPPDASLADIDPAEVGRLRLFAERSGGSGPHPSPAWRISTFCANWACWLPATERCGPIWQASCWPEPRRRSGRTFRRAKSAFFTT